MRGQTPKVDAQDKKKLPKGRAMKRIKYNRRFVNVGEIQSTFSSCLKSLSHLLYFAVLTFCVYVSRNLQWLASARRRDPTLSKQLFMCKLVSRAPGETFKLSGGNVIRCLFMARMATEGRGGRI